jgi:hypothetical protein
LQIAAKVKRKIVVNFFRMDCVYRDTESSARVLLEAVRDQPGKWDAIEPHNQVPDMEH